MLYVCPYVHPGTQLKNYCSDWLDFLTQYVLWPWLGHPLRWSGPRSGSGLENSFKDSWPLGDKDKICTQSTQWLQTCVVMKTHVTTSHLHHNERGLSSLIALLPVRRSLRGRISLSQIISVLFLVSCVSCQRIPAEWPLVTGTDPHWLDHWTLALVSTDWSPVIILWTVSCLALVVVTNSSCWCVIITNAKYW